MTKDYIVNGIIKELKSDVFKHWDITLSDQRVLDVVNSEFKCLKEPFNRGVHIKMDYLGSFGIREGRLEIDYLITKYKNLGYTGMEIKEKITIANRIHMMEKRKAMMIANEYRKKLWDDNQESLQRLADATGKTYKFSNIRKKRFIEDIETTLGNINKNGIRDE